MSKKTHLRKDLICLNCAHSIDDRFCTHCGQENTETRQSFSHLVAHFFEDITHYDSGFWRTIKYLLFRPAFLTKEYLAGKRQSFVAPIRLYFFISFVCFFLPAILPDIAPQEGNSTTKQAAAADSVKKMTEHLASKSPHKFRDGLLLSEFTFNEGAFSIEESPNDYTSLRQLDSMQKVLPPDQRYNKLEYRMAKHTIYLFNHYSKEEIREKSSEAFHHNLSKALFVYLPFFAFFVWVFHNKKRWLYFDHAIFSIHYFSFLLLVITLFTVEFWLLDPIRNLNAGLVVYLSSMFGMLLWIFYYFFRANYKMYPEKVFISILKSTVLLAINLVFIVLLFIFFTNYTMYMLH